MRIMKNTLAPIIIPTLNRYEHLLNCIESLRQNSLASETDLYISVDYPPSSKYEDGHCKIVNYFQNNTVLGFKSVNIFYQKSNLGPLNNYDFLISVIENSYDYFIFSEDDNIFSRNYLEFMNYYLDKYKNDEKIYCVCGYSIPIKWDSSASAVKKNLRIISAYGYGLWFQKEKTLYNFTLDSLQKNMLNFKKSKTLFSYSKKLFCDAINAARSNHYIMLNDEKKLLYVDITRCIYCILTKKYIIMPTISKVRNMGYDGSGVNCLDNKRKSATTTSIYTYDFSTQPIDKEPHFDGTRYEIKDFSKKEYRQLNKYIPISKIDIIKSLVKWILFNLKRPAN